MAKTWREREALAKTRSQQAASGVGRRRQRVAMVDYYSVLGIPRDASPQQIKQAYRRLALQFHPDLHSQSPKPLQDAAALRFRQISEAYQVLHDPALRSLYNRDGPSGLCYRQPPDPRYGPSSASGDWSRQRHYAYGRSARPASWNFRVSLSPLDMAFHAVLAGIIVVGLTYGDIIGKSIWDKKNAGKSFEDLVQTGHQKKKTALGDEE